MAAKNENEKRLTKEEKEMQLLLDSMLVPFSDYKKNLAANRKLEPSDEDKKLLKIVSDLERLKKSGAKANIEKCLDMALEDIAKMMNEHGGYKNNVGYVSEQPHKQVLPFLIQQVLFYIAALCIEYYNGEQKVVIQELRKLDVTISHNFFSRKRTTPKQYIDMKRYTQPELPANYKGNKCGELAVAIKNLVYQAGEYDIFCDVFGGSGAASLAVNRRKEAEYVYNELDKMTQNLFAVIKDNNKYEDLIKALEALQLDLRGGKKWINSKFDSYIKTYTENKKYMDNKEHEILGNRKLLTSKLSMTDAEKIRLMENFHDGINRSGEDFVLKCAGRSYSRQELLNEIFVDCTYYRNVALKNFSDYFYLISELSCYSYSFSLIGYNVNFPNNAAWPNSRLIDIVDQYEQCRAYEYFVYFGCILNDLSWLSQDKVLCAVAKIFMLSFSFYGDAQLSNILRMRVSDEEQEKSYDVFSEFVKKDFKGIITEMHNAIKGTICKDLDCVDVIEKYGKNSGKENYKNSIFYSDSPYIATSNYAVMDGDGKESTFTEDDMKRLINALKKSEGKFIFSCRAVSGAGNGSATTRKLKDNNIHIFRSVYIKFIEAFDYEDNEKRQKLWVLAIVDATKSQKYTFADLISKNRVVELMITNFEIHSFSDANYPNIRFEVYEFSELLEALMLYSNADINKDWKEKDVDWYKNERLYKIMKRGEELEKKQ